MTLDDEYKLLIGAYYGVKYLDEYELKEYLLNDIKEYIKEFIKNNKISDCEEKAEKYEKDLSKKTKLQNALIVLQSMNASIEVVLLIRKYIKSEN